MKDERVGVQVKAIDDADEVIEFLDGSMRVAVELMGSVIFGHGTYLPGWRWSVHVAPISGRISQRHFGYVLSGRMAVRSTDGVENEAGPNQAFAAEPGHDAWVVGDEACVAIDWWPIT